MIILMLLFLLPDDKQGNKSKQKLAMKVAGIKKPAIIVAGIRKPAIIVAGIGYNVRAAVERWRPRMMEFLSRVAGDYRMVFYENDSIDGTPALLEQWSNEDAKVITICEKTDVKTCARNLRKTHEKLGSLTQRMADCRNRYLDILYEHQDEWEQTFDVLWIVDMDMDEDFNEKVVEELLTKHYDHWDVVFANGLMKGSSGSDGSTFPYDSLAFNDEVYWQEPSDLIVGDDKTAEAESLFWSHDYIWEKRGYMQQLAEEKTWIPVWSAFGGMGLYKLSMIYGSDPKPRYAGRRFDDLAPVCEHSIFHDLLPKDVRKFVYSPWKVMKGAHVHYDE